MASLKRFDCLAAGCTFRAEAESDEELVSAVQTHVAEAHGSFELEEFILAGAVPVSEDKTQQDSPRR